MLTLAPPLALMFHEVFPHQAPDYLTRSGRYPGNREWAVSDLVFQELLTTLRELGLESSEKVLLTFDDGGLSAFEYAAPLLEQHGFRGLFFVCSALIGTKGYMNEAQLRALHQRGHTIGSHSATHAILTTLSDADLKRELEESRDWITQTLGQSCEAFAIPGGFSDRRVKRAIVKAGYRTVFTSRIPGFMKTSAHFTDRWHVRPEWSRATLIKVYQRQIKTILPMMVRQRLLELPKQVLGYERYVRLSKGVKRVLGDALQ